MATKGSEPLENTRREKFCQHYAKGMSLVDAYAEAGYRPSRANSARLIANDSVRARVRYLQGQGAKKAEVTVEGVIKMLRDSYTDAKHDGQHGPAVKAAELLGKTLAMFTDVKVKMPYEDLSDDQLQKRVKEAIDARRRAKG